MALTYNEAVEQTIIAGEQLHQIINGTGAAEVIVEDGSEIPTIRKALLDNFYFKDPLLWAEGQSEVVFNQLRKFTDGSWWYPPTATASNPITMDTTPIGDPLWHVYSLDAVVKLTPQLRESLRRSYAEAGYNLVTGSFESGGALVNTNDVLLYESNGKCYSGPVGAVAAGTNPISGPFVDKSFDLLRTQLLDSPLRLNESRFALRDWVSVADFTGANDTERFSKAISYLINTNNGGSIFVPAGTWVADIDQPTNIELVGTGEKSIIKGATTGPNSCTVKLSYSDVGVYPYGVGKIPNKNARIKDLVIDANGADFGLYMAYCLFPDISGVNIYRAKVRNLYMAAVFSYSIDKMLLSYCESRGGSMGDNIFGWTGGVEGIHCNAGNARRLIAFGNGTNTTYDKVTAPSGGAGFTVTGGSGNTFTAFQGEQNKGPGLYVAQNTQVEFHGLYFEANANDGTSDFRQCVNESTGAVFYDVEPRFNAADTFHCAVHTRIFNYFGNRITGAGPVSVYGKYDAASVETPNVQTVALVERLAFNTGAGRIRMNMLKPAPRATEGFYKTGIYEMGAFVSFKSTVTVGTGGSAKTILITTITGTVLTTLTIPPATYNDGDIVYVKFNQPTIGDYSVVEMGFGGGAVINVVDCGIYAKFMV